MRWARKAILTVPLATAMTKPVTATSSTDPETPLFMEVRRQDVGKSTFSLGPTQGDGAFLPFKDIGVAVKACNDTLAQLQQLGVSHVVSLPELVLVGDQSSGKSSLMSSIGYLNLPRSEGVCTRCPIHIRLSSNSEWSARISLHIDYAFRPRQGHMKVTISDKFPPWVRQARETKDFKILGKDHRDRIEECLRWAQVALLTPDTSHTSFEPDVGHIAIGSSLAEAITKMTAKFSPNIIGLEIKGPDLPDLSFFDLPGLIKSTAKEEDTYLVKVVENLAKEYIGREKAIVLWAVPMTQDPDNSSTFQVIREMRATDRTVGVMTKADLLQQGDQSQWIRMLEGHPNAFRVGHGYFVTSRPQQINMDEAARWEKEFFTGHTDSDTYIPGRQWPEELMRFQYRSGVDHLRKFLSGKLSEEFARR